MDEIETYYVKNKIGDEDIIDFYRRLGRTSNMEEVKRKFREAVDFTNLR